MSVRAKAAEQRTPVVPLRPGPPQCAPLEGVLADLARLAEAQAGRDRCAVFLLSEDGAQLGVGIPGMRERLGQMGGQLELRSGPQGTIVRAILTDNR